MTRQRLKKEGDEIVINCHGLKIRALDGKMRKTDVAISCTLKPSSNKDGLIVVFQ